MSALIDLSGQRFGRLLVLGMAVRYQRPDGRARTGWVVRCDCGTEKVVDGYVLRRGMGRSCGCLQRELTSARSKASGIIKKAIAAKTTHGKSRTPEYRIWADMIQRCTNPARKAWKDYGGRGITVCDGWRHSFESFIANVGPRPSPGHSIDRIDNDRGYEPGNVRWATRAQQHANRRPQKPIKWTPEMDATARQLRAAGVMRKDIAAKLGVAGNTVGTWLKRC